MRGVARYVVARIRDRPGRGALVVLGIALAALLLVATDVVRVRAGDAALRAAVRSLPAGDRAFTVTFSGNGVDGAELGRRDVAARSAFAELGITPSIREVLFSERVDAAGTPYRVAAVDGLERIVRLHDGRLPVSCGARRCEVLVTGTAAEPDLPTASGLVVVGHGAVADPAVLGGTFSLAPGAVVLLTGDVAGLTSLRPSELYPRSYGWVAPLAADELTVAAIPALRGRIAAAANRAARDLLSFSAPDEVLSSSLAAATGAANRLLLVGGTGATLLLAFAALAALALARDHGHALAVLRRLGASRAERAAFSLAEAGVPVVLGTAVAVAVALAVGSDRSVLVPVLVLAIVATGLVTVALRRDVDVVRTALGPLDAIGGSALAVAVLGASRGDASATALSVRSDPFLAALPILVAVVAAAVAVRVIGPALGAVGRRLPRRMPLARLMLADATARPLRLLATAGFLTAAVTLAVFAGAYRATLARGAVDQAAYRVPLAASVRTGPTLDLPLEVAPLERWRALPGVDAAARVVRRSATIRTTGAAAEPVTLLGIDRTGVTALDGARPDYGPPPAVLARLLATDATPVTADVAALRVTGDVDRVDVSVIRARAGGGVVIEPLDGTPRDVAGLIGVRVQEPPGSSDKTLHHIFEGGSSVEAYVARVRLHGRGFPWAAVEAHDAEIRQLPDGLEIGVELRGRTAIVRLPQPSERTPIPALVDPETARTARDGVATVATAGAAPIAVRVVATARRFPTAGERFVVADAGAVQGALDTRDPGTGSVGELWLAGADPAPLRTSARSAPADRFRVELRDDVERTLRRDALARGALALLAIASVTALILASIGVALVVRAEATDGRVEWRALEADGAPPQALRLVVFGRVMAVVAIAIPIGVVAGASLARETAGLVRSTAAAAVPIPPLIAATDWSFVLVAAAATLAGVALVALVTALTSMRGRHP